MKPNHFGIVSLGLLTAACGSTAKPISTDAGDGASSGFGFTPSNVDIGMLDLSNIGDIDIVKGCGTGVIGTDVAVRFTCNGKDRANYALITQPDKTKVAVFVARSWRLEPKVTLKVSGPYPVILVGTEKIEIFGKLVAAGNAQFNVAGGFRDSNTADSQGGGPGGGEPGTSMGAGGGGSYCGIGGSGGGGGPGGTAYGTPEIVPLTGGSSGGQGAFPAGAGGGAIQLVAGHSVSIGASAYVDVGGGGVGSIPWGSGGGSGGSILIESQAVTIAGTLAANGGGGAAGGYDGKAGADALPSDKPAPGGTNKVQASTEGGDGSAAGNVNGASGSVSPKPGTGAGGGGGGAGRIRINTKSGSATLTGATLSPDATTSCSTQGKVH